MADSKYFDAIMADNKKLENTAIPEGAMTYGDYLTASGIDTQADLDAAQKAANASYNASVKAAAQEYDRALGTYGQNAENMAQGGLTGSGYSDYLTGNAYAARQGSIDAAKAVKQASLDTAEATKKVTEASAQQGYLNYIENYKTQQKTDKLSAMNNIIDMGLTGEGAKTYLEAIGITNGDEILGVTEAVLGNQNEKTVDANYFAMIENVASLMNAGIEDADIRKILANQYGYDEAKINDFMATATKYKDKFATSAAAEDATNAPKIQIDPQTWSEYKSNLAFLEDLEARFSNMPSQIIINVAEKFGMDISRLGKLYNEAAKVEGTAARNETFKRSVLAELGNNPEAKAMMEGYDAYVDYLEDYYSGTYSDADVADFSSRLTGVYDKESKK